jgi:hypothetical protein
MGVWRSVNDLQVQLGLRLFRQFLVSVERRIAGMTAIDNLHDPSLGGPLGEIGW